jgi:hypothetical protein
MAARLDWISPLSARDDDTCGKNGEMHGFAIVPRGPHRCAQHGARRCAPVSGDEAGWSLDEATYWRCAIVSQRDVAAFAYRALDAAAAGRAPHLTNPVAPTEANYATAPS